MSREGPATIMEYLRRLEYERKMEKLYKRKSSFHGFALAEHSHRVKRTNAFESSTLRTKMGIIHKEEQSSKHYRKKNLSVVENLESSIHGPVSCTIPGTSKAELVAAERERSAIALAQRRAKLESQGQAREQPSERQERSTKSITSEKAESAKPSTASAKGKKVTIKEDRTYSYKSQNRQPRSKTELQNSLTYEPPPSAKKNRRSSMARRF